VVVITHGIRDHALRYGAFARQLNAQGYAVYAQDLRGHAHSGGQRQRFDSMAQLVADTDLVVEAATRAHPGTPVFAFGHSVGGLVTTQYALAHGGKLKGVVSRRWRCSARTRSTGRPLHTRSSTRRNCWRRFHRQRTDPAIPFSGSRHPVRCTP
jgi:pimeloyl-ACP methyl ester carboxylesterase